MKGNCVRSVWGLFLMASVLASAPLRAADDDEKSKLLKFIEGTWDVSLDGSDKQSVSTFRSAAGGKALIHEIKDSNGRLVAGVVGFESDVMVHTTYSSNGDYQRIEYNDFQEKAFRGTVSGVVDGKPFKDRNILVEKIDQDTVRATATGGEIPDQTIKLVRRPKQSTEAQKAFQAFGALMVGGTWTHADEAGAELIHEYRWALDKQFIQVRSVQEENPFLAVIGVDSESGKMRWWWFGNSEQQGTTVGRASVVEHGNDTWTSKGEMIGTKFTSQGQWKLTKVDADTIQVRVQITRDGVAADPVQSEWKRK